MSELTTFTRRTAPGGVKTIATPASDLLQSAYGDTTAAMYVLPLLALSAIVILAGRSRRRRYCFAAEPDCPTPQLNDHRQQPSGQ
jgi:hypothetical protein